MRGVMKTGCGELVFEVRHLICLQLATFVDYTWQRMRICSEVSAVPNKALHSDTGLEPQVCNWGEGPSVGQQQGQAWNRGNRGGGGGGGGEGWTVN